MADRWGIFCVVLTLSKLIFLGEFCLICSTESTIFTEEDPNKETNVPTLSTTGSALVDDPLANGAYVDKPSAESTLDSKDDTNVDSITDSPDLTSTKTLSELDVTDSSEIKTDVLETDNPDDATGIKSESDFQSSTPNSVNNSDDINSENITHVEYLNQTLTNLNNSKAENFSAGNSTNKTAKPSWSCMKYNITLNQTVIILKDKNNLTWWLDELNKTMGCAVVLFYAKWCYFSTSLAPMYNAVGRAFSGIPILAIDAYTHNSLNTRYGIVGVPTIILFQESRPVARFNRTRTFKDLVQFIHQNTGMEYNASVEVSPIDYEEGPLPSAPSDEFNIYLLASLCFLLCIASLVLWRLQYVHVFVEYFMSLTFIRTMFRADEHEKID